MNLQSTKGYYVLEGILDYKEKTVIGGVDFYIANNFKNNLRERNSQLGIVRATPPENPLKLEIGDTVCVNHFTFMGDIGEDKSYQLRPHTVIDGKKLFRVHPNNIFFTYNDKVVKVLGETIICEEVMEDIITKSGIFVESIHHKDRANVTHGNADIEDGALVVVEQHALYPIELDKKEYLKIMLDDVVAVIDNGMIKPYKGRVYVQDLPAKEHFLDLSLANIESSIHSKVIAVGVEVDDIEVGDTIIRTPNSGIAIDGGFIINPSYDHVIAIVKMAV